MEFPKKGIYRHFKGGRYELLDFARDSESEEWLVIYRAMYGDNGLWARPLRMWSEVVERDGQRMPRFAPEDAPEPVSEPAPEPIQPKTKADVLRHYFGYSEFRPGQEEIVDALLGGKDVLAVMPTGAGKSLCYQVPSLLLEGIALVISPLIALMKDQVQALIQLGVPAAFLNSSLTERQIALALRNMAQGKYKIIYVAPERLTAPRFLEAVKALNVSMVAVDEAHCISQWGQDFRPSYLDIADFIARFERRPIVGAFTATATQKVREDILRLLRLDDPVVKTTGFDRKNLYYAVRTVDRGRDKVLLECLEGYRGLAGIVYCMTRKNVEKVCELLRDNGFSATRYHAGLPDEERRANQEDFTYDRADIMVATNAFGMGIDKSNVRFVVHYNMPKDPESYYQEAGRAGRDGARADCILLYSRADIMTQKMFIDHMGEEGTLDETEIVKLQLTARSRLDKMVRYCETASCLRGYLLEYFGETAPHQCSFCSNCLSGSRGKTDVSAQAVQVLDCLDQLGRSYGRAVITDVLHGDASKAVSERGLSDVLCFGALSTWEKDDIQKILNALIDEGAIYVDQKALFPVLKLGENADAVRDGSRHIVISARRKVQRKVQAPVFGEADVNPELYARLKALRLKLARARGLPPYAVFNDATLMEMARVMPKSPEEMERIKGVGVVKMRNFGSAFYKEISKYLKEEK